jgi:Plavaka transposase
MSATNIDLLMELWASSMEDFDASSPFRSHQHMHTIIDSSSLSDAPWKCLVSGFSESVTRDAPSWKQTDYEVWYRDPDQVVHMMLDNPDFNGQFDLCPYVELDKHGKCCWSNVMSANIAWNRCVSIKYCVHLPCNTLTASQSKRMTLCCTTPIIHLVQCTVH